MRAASDADYEAIASIICQTQSSWRPDGRELRRDDAGADPKYLVRRIVAESRGDIVGHSCFGHFWERFDPRKFLLSVGVLPNERSHGIGSALIDTAMTELAPFDPISIRSSVIDTDDNSIQFAQKRGFVEIGRQWESVLDVNASNPEAFADQLNVLDRENLAIKSYLELADDPKRDAKLYELETALCADMPDPEPYTPIPYEQYLRTVLRDPLFLPDGYLVLVDGDRYVGISNVYGRETDDCVWVNVTGVRREYRGSGLAFALKVRVLQYAKKRVHPRIYTDNSTTNAAMIAINKRLGFTDLPGEILLRRTIS